MKPRSSLRWQRQLNSLNEKLRQSFFPRRLFMRLRNWSEAAAEVRELQSTLVG